LGIVLESGQIMAAMLVEARRRLEEHRATLERAVRSHAVGNSSVVQDLAETNAAIDRLDGGTYGRCERCGGAIGRQRLLALPAARYCISCAPAARGS
jgi:DnaK suppressor protein